MNRSIKRDFYYLSLITIIVSMVLLSGFWIYYDYRSLQIESIRIRDRYMAEYRSMLKYHVNRVVNEIKYEQSIAEQSLKKSLKERVSQGRAIITSIIAENSGKVDQRFLHKIIKDSLRSIRFNNGRDNFFIVNAAGIAELFPGSPALEGKDLSRQHNNQGRMPVRELLEMASTSEEGFLQYNWPKGNERREDVPILTYFTYLPELHWLLGTSEYLDDFTAEVQSDVIARTEQIRFGDEKKEYIFIANYDGIGISFPAKGKNMLETRDPNGVYIVKELIKQAKAGGGFVQYVMPTLGGLESKPKLSYAAPIPEWRWYVGAGVYIDEIDAVIHQNRQLFAEQVKRHLLIMTVVLVCLMLCHFLVGFFISRKIWQQIDLFSTFFRKARSESISMQTDLLDYKEFREISRHANDMLKERNSILKEIKLAHDEWVNTFNAIGDCIIVLNRDGIVEKANESAANFLGPSPAELVGTPFAELCYYDNPVQQTLQDHCPHTMEIEVQDRGRRLLASSFPLFTDDGQLSRIIHISHDITEQKKLEQQLLQAQKMEAIGTLAGGIAHDFNNILAAIIGFTELAHNDLQENRPVDHYLEQVLTAGARARDLVRQILTFSRQPEMEKTAVQPAEIVAEALRLLRSSLPTTIQFEQQIDKDLGFLLIDPTQLHQIVMNLCTNAYHAMEENGGTLSVALSQHYLDNTALADHPHCMPGDYIQLLIRDTGCGIDPALHKKIFEPFFTTKKVGKGTGMGLAIVHGIVKDCGGFITCESEVGKGATFRANLPVYAEKSVPTTDINLSQLPDSKRILFIDDEKVLAEMSRIVLERLGFAVTAFSSSIEALAAFEKAPQEFDLVITDQTMPEMTGIDLARNILKVRPDLPIILCTGYSSTVSSEDARNEGIKGFAMKPLARDEIARIINEVFMKQ